MNKFESSEDYLERILMLQEKNGKVRAIDIAKEMDFSKASVSIALKKLREKNHIVVDEDTGTISLTPEGSKIAEDVYNRHKILTRFFMNLGVSKEQAIEDACKVEHDLSIETFEKLEKFVNKI